MCDGCDSLIDPGEMVMEGISLSDGSKGLTRQERRKPLQLHVNCFYLWDAERRNNT
jgi:hypothetical protein